MSEVLTWNKFQSSGKQILKKWKIYADGFTFKSVLNYKEFENMFTFISHPTYKYYVCVITGIILPASNHFKMLRSPNLCLKLYISKHVKYIHIYLSLQCSKYIFCVQIYSCQTEPHTISFLGCCIFVFLL